MERKIFLITGLLIIGLIEVSFAKTPVFRNDGIAKVQVYQLDVGWNSTPAQLDWDRDGLKDLVIGDREGYVWFFRNTGTEFHPNFTTGEKIRDYNTQQPIQVGEFATPFVIDYDNNGLYDLIVGNKYGTITRFPMMADPPYVESPIQISLTNHTFQDVYFVDNNLGWIVGNNGIIFYTTDGGNTWIPQQSNTNENINSVHFLNLNEGWAIGNTGITLRYYTPPGQNEPIWEATRTVNLHLQSIFFVDANNGWAVGDGGTILHYTNGRWATQTAGITQDFHSVFFIDGQTGWIVGERRDPTNGTILRTTNGGVTWTPIAVDVTDLYSITRPPGTTTLWAVGANGTIIRSFDGTTWGTVASPVNTNLYSVHFIDANNGWIVGANGTILQYVNDAWTSINLGISSDLYSVFFKNATHGWAVGDNSTILFYDGTNWRTQTLKIDIGDNSAPFMFDLDEDGKKDLLIGDKQGNVWFFKNIGSDHLPTFRDGFRMNIGTRAVTGTYTNFIDVGQFATPQVVDWTGDGIKDLIIGNEEGNIFLFRGAVISGTITQGLIPLPAYRILVFEHGNRIQVANLNIDIGRRAAPLVIDWNKDGGLDLLIGEESGSIYVFLNDSPYQPPQFTFSSKVQGPPIPLQIGLYSTPAIIDWNDDQRKDLLIGDKDGFVTLFLNVGTDRLPKFTDGFKLKVWGTNTQRGTFTEDVDVGEFAKPFPVDWNNDYRKDIIIGNKAGEIFYFRNIRDDKASLFTPGIKITAGTPAVTLDVGEYATPVVIDWNNDNKKDLIVGNKNGNVFLYLNIGTDDAPVFGTPTKLTTLPGGIIDVGEFATPFVTDYNGDNKKDLIIGDSQGYITVFLNLGTDENPILDEGKKIRIEGEGNIDVGKHASPWIVDYDNSCSLDLVVGNKEGFVKLYLSSGVVEIYLIKSVNKTYAYPGDILTYTIEYGNRGDFNASNLEIIDALPPLTEFVRPVNNPNIDAILYFTDGSWSNQYSNATTKIKWLRNQLLQGEIGQKISFEVRIVNTGVISNYVEAKSDQTYPQISNIVTTIGTQTPTPDFSTIQKFVYPEGEIFPGTLLSFTIRYKNTGNGTATNVMITDVIDLNLYNVIPRNNGVYNSGVIRWNLGTILPGHGGEVRFEATVFAPLQPGVVIKNRATITTNNLLWHTNEVQVIIAETGSEGDDWPMFRFNLAHEGYDFREVIRTPLQLKWTHTLGSRILSSPVVAHGRLYIGTFDRKVYIFDTQSGNLIGSYSTTAVIDSTPAVTKGRIYAVDSRGDVYCWGINPGFKWMKSLNTSVHLSSCAVADGILYVGGIDGRLYALSIVNGEIKWVYPTGGGIYSSPAVVNGRVYFGSSDGNLYCLTTSGEKLWQFGTVGRIYSSPAVKDGIVYVGSDDGYIYAINMYSGVEIWRYRTNSQVRSSPAIADQVIFCGSQDGYLYAINKDGSFRWAHLIGSPIDSSPAVANGVVYFGANNGYIYGLDVNTGRELWKYSTGHSRIYSSPAIADGMLYIASSDGKLYAFTSHADFSNSDLNKKLGSIIGTVKVGDEITYTIKFYNEGLGEAVNFKIEDKLDPYIQFISASHNGTYSNGVVTWNIGTVGANSGGSVILRVKVGTNTPHGTVINNLAKFSWNINLFRNTNIFTNTVIREVITTLKVVNIQENKVKPGDRLVYTISYTNNANFTLTEVNISDKISPYLTNINPANGGKYERGIITWQIGNLNPNESGEVKFTCEVASPIANGIIIQNNTAVFNSSQIFNKEIFANPQTLTVIAPAFNISKTYTGSFIPGETITYVINYTNIGSLTARGVEIWDVVDRNLEVDLNSLARNAIYTQDNHTIKWSLGQININTSGSVSFRAKIKMPLPNGTLIKNKATITSLLIPEVVTNEVIGTVSSKPDFRYSTKDVFPKDGIPLNKILTYTINYRNTGVMDAEDVVIIDKLDPHLSVSTVTSYAEVISGVGTLNLNVHNGWTQFDNGTVNGNIIIVTSNGTYTSKQINNYPRIQDLMDEINANPTAKVNISYDSNSDRFTIYSLNGSIVSLQEFGTNPFFTAIKIPTGIYCSGKYLNGTIRWDIGKVKVGEEGSVTFRAMVIGTPTQVSNQAIISFFGTFNVTNKVTNTVDITPPPIGVPPTEGGIIDLDADVDGNYTVYWRRWNDKESGIAKYELQESNDKINWITLSNTIPANIEYFHITNRIKGTTYYYRLRAMNGAGLWSAYSDSSDGIRIVDKSKIIIPATGTTVILSSPNKSILQHSNLESGQTVVQIPPGAFNGTVTFTISKVNPPITDLKKSSPIISAILDDSARELMALEENYYGRGTQPIRPIIVTLPFSDPDPNDEDADLSYRIYRLVGDHWEIVPGKQIVDASRNLVTAYEVNQLSIFAVAAPITHLQDLIVYPNPFKLRLGHKDIKFKNLSGKVNLRIYNIAGELVFNEDNITTPIYQWPIVNNVGDRVASGVYVYIITNEKGEIVKGKVAIIK